MNLILRLFLTVSSVSFFIVVYLCQNCIYPTTNLPANLNWIICIGYVVVPFALTAISMLLSRGLSKSTLNDISSVETSNNDFLANYLAFFFVALSVKGIETFWVVFGLTVIFTFFSRVSFFNPILLVFGYNFFYVKTNENVKIMLICKRKLKNPQSFKTMEVRRINDYTFIGA